MIGCVYFPHFAAAVERRDDPSLAGAPLVIVERAGESARVVAACGEAARLGVQRDGASPSPTRLSPSAAHPR